MVTTNGLIWALLVTVVYSSTTTPIPTNPTTSSPTMSPTPPNPTMPALTLTNQNTPLMDATSKHRSITTELSISSSIISRYARTVMTSRVVNTNLINTNPTKSQEINYQITLPDSAFISNFTIEIDQKQYVATVNTKEAKYLYDAAVANGKDAAHIQARDTNVFLVQAAVGAGKEVTFHVTYEELLSRKHGVYQNLISITPKQVVDKLSVDVYIQEKRDIVRVIVPGFNRNSTFPDFRSGGKCSGGQKCTPVKSCVGVDEKHLQTSNLCGYDILTFSPKICCGSQTGMNSSNLKIEGFGTKSVHISYSEDKKPSTEGISGQFAVKYDVDRTFEEQELQVEDGYFVQFIAPQVRSYLNKHVVFVLDTSASMAGRKLDQLKIAMNSILTKLKEGDKFNIIEYSSSAKVLGQDALPVDAQSINHAKDYVQNLTAGGLKNINEALLKAIHLTTTEWNLVPVVIFLTDGHANAGVSDTTTIIDNVKSANSRSNAHIFTLAFGPGADYSFLNQLSLLNGGFVRRIYEASDAAQQMQNFYEEISTPLLSNVVVRHLNASVIDKASVSKLNTDSLWDEGEIVLTGQLKDRCLQGGDMMVQVLADSPVGRGTYATVSAAKPQSSCSSATQSQVEYWHYCSVERIWAYNTIKDIMDDIVMTDDIHEKLTLQDRAIALALQYNFVTGSTPSIAMPSECDPSTGLGSFCGANGTFISSAPADTLPDPATSTATPAKTTTTEASVDPTSHTDAPAKIVTITDLPETSLDSATTAVNPASTDTPASTSHNVATSSPSAVTSSPSAATSPNADTTIAPTVLA